MTTLFAHAGGLLGRADLPIPEWLFGWAAAIVLASSREPTAATDLEWPGLILRADRTRLRGLRCEGLEWETPDFHPAAIATAGGVAAWTRAVFDTPAMWTARLRLAAASTAALERVLTGEKPYDRAAQWPAGIVSGSSVS